MTRCAATATLPHPCTCQPPHTEAVEQVVHLSVRVVQERLGLHHMQLRHGERPRPLVELRPCTLRTAAASATCVCVCVCAGGEYVWGFGQSTVMLLSALCTHT